MKLMVLDGNSIINRAFYGIRPLSASDGTPTNAVYGFLMILKRLLNEENPDALCVCFDVHAPTFRHKQFADYKAQRKPMPEELRPQIPLAKEILSAMRVPVYTCEGWEADDLIGTIARRCEQDAWQCVIVTGDRDSLQLISPTTKVKLIVSRMGKTDTIDYTPEKFFEDYQFSSEKIVDLKALWGDSSDNIPGVPGVGEKTAKDLIISYGNVAAIYENLESLDLRDSVKNKLRNGKESAFLSYDLATIRRDAPIEFVPANNLRGEFDGNALYALFKRLDFSKLIKDWKLEAFAGTPANEENELVLDFGGNAKTVESTQTFDAAALARIDVPEIFVLQNNDGLKIAAGTTIFEADALAFPQALQAIFTGTHRVIAYDLKSLYRAFLKFQTPNFQLSTLNFFDISLAAYVLDPARKMSVPASIAELRELYEKQTAALANEAGFTKLLNEIELPLTFLLAEIEATGILVDREKLVNFSRELEQKTSVLQREIFDDVGEVFNLNSTKQLAVILFEKLQLPAKHKTKSGYSTDAEVLKELLPLSPVVAKILNFRQLGKLKTIADGLIESIANDGRIHTTFNQTVTITGRLSSSEPNLQNVPARGELGGDLRKMFVAKPGCAFVDADYSQVELRVLAHISGDKVMKKAFRENEDIHAVTACNVFHCEPEQITPTMRRHAKAVNFGIVYGIGEFALAQSLGITRKDAKTYMENYFKKYAGVRKYMDEIVEKARGNGFVETVLGRRRNLPELAATNKITQKLGERLALNTPIQGSAADIMKVAMLKVAAALKKDVPAARIVLQIHDELIIETPNENVEQVKIIVTREMQYAFPLTVPLVAESAAATNWLEAK